MDVREKLAELLNEAGDNVFIVANQPVEPQRQRIWGEIAEYLIAHGVTLGDQVASISKQLASSEWISVKDRLPEEPLQTVIVTNGKETCVAVYSVVYDEFGVMCGKGKAFGVTHWMPLPEPPKEDNNEQA